MAVIEAPIQLTFDDVPPPPPKPIGFYRSRWPVDPVRRLLRQRGISDNDLKRRDIHVKWSRGRLTTPMADTLAVSVLKLHPGEKWPDWFDD